MKEMPMANTETTKSARTAKTAAEKASAEAVTAGAATKDLTDAAFAYPKFEVPEVFRSFAEQGLSQTREAYSRMKAAAEEATDLFEESFETTREGVREVQFKALDVVKENTDAALDLMRKLLTATSVADAVQLQTTFARERFEAMVDYSKDVQATWSKVGTEASKPAKAIFDKAMSLSKAA
jgi:phasin